MSVSSPPVRLALFVLALLVSTGCQGIQRGSEPPTGSITTLATGTVVRVKKIKLLVNNQTGTFANMSGRIVGTISPSLIAEGTQNLANAAGSLIDDRVHEEPGVQVRVRMDDAGGTLKQITQLADPSHTFHVGDKVCISTGSTPGNVFPD